MTNMRSIGDFVNQGMSTAAPTLFIVNSTPWILVQEILKNLGINTSTIESINKRKFIYGSRSSFNRSIQYFEEENKQFIKLKMREENRSGEKADNFFSVGESKIFGKNKRKLNRFLQESEKIQLFLMAAILNKADSRYFFFDSEKENEHYAKKFKLFKLNFNHELNKHTYEAPVTPRGIYEIEQTPLTEVLLSNYRAALQSTGLRVFLYDLNGMHGDVILTLNTIQIPPPQKEEHVDHVYILRHMTGEKNWKRIRIHMDEKEVISKMDDGYDEHILFSFLNLGGFPFNFNEYEAFKWIKANRAELFRNPNLQMPKELLPAFEYAYDFDRYREQLGYDDEAKEENDRLNAELDQEIENRRHYEEETPIEDEDNISSDSIMGPDIEDLDQLDQYDEEAEEAAIRAAEMEESNAIQAEDEEFKRIEAGGTSPSAPKVSDAEIVDFFHKLDEKQIGLLKKLIDISKK